MSEIEPNLVEIAQTSLIKVRVKTLTTDNVTFDKTLNKVSVKLKTETVTMNDSIIVKRIKVT